MAHNPATGLIANFDRRGFEVRPESGRWSWGLELTSYGVGAMQRPIKGKAAAVRTEARRVTYDWDKNLEEWYQNDAQGLEHGFTIQSRPETDSQHESLTLRLRLRGGLRSVGEVVGRNIAFGNEKGDLQLSYSNLRVVDALGHQLDAWFEEDCEETFRIVVEDVEAIYPVTIDPTIGQQAYLKGTYNRGYCCNFFGSSMAISGDTVVVGATHDASMATGVNGDPTLTGFPNAGAAYVFVRNGETWSQQAYLKASNTQELYNFGQSVAISGDTVIVGSPGEASNATGVNGNQSDNSAEGSGAAYVFVRSGTTWSQQSYLKASNTESYDGFGWSVAISGDTVVVGSLSEDSNATWVNGDQSDNSAEGSGAAYVFVRSGMTWSQQAYLKANNTRAEDYFAVSVAIFGDTVIVGAFGADVWNYGSNSGAAYVFVRYGTYWSQQGFLLAFDRGISESPFNPIYDPDDGFGVSVAISGDTVVVGAFGEDIKATGVNGQGDYSASASGAAYVFVRDGTTWSQQAYLKASNTQAGDLFGESVAISGDTVVVGARGEDSNATGVNGNQSDNSAENSGAAYVFVRSGTTWRQQAYLKASNTESNDGFGIVAISGDTVVVGAMGEDSNATGVNGDQSNNSLWASGAAYIFSLSAPTIVAASGITRIIGIYGSNSIIASVSDLNVPINTLRVTVTSANPAVGIKLSNIVNTNGTITADITANTTASAGVVSFILQVSNGTSISTATLTVTVVAVTSSNPSISLPASSGSAISPGSSVTITQTLSNVSSFPVTTVYVAILPGGLNALSCTSQIGTCVIGTGTQISPGSDPQGLSIRNTANSNSASQTITWSGIIPANGSVTIIYQVQVGVQATSGTQYCITSTVNGITGPSSCLTVNVPPSGPGNPLIFAGLPNTQKPASLLIFNIFTSSGSGAQSETLISLTNTNPVNPSSVHLFFVDGATCTVADQIVTLTQNQTASFLASDIDPGVTGYLIAVAVDSAGCPTISNYLIGTETVRFESGHHAMLPAIGVAGISLGSSPCQPSSTVATILFDGIRYDTLPRSLAIATLPSLANGNSSMLIVNRIGGDLTNGAERLGTLAGLLFDDSEVSRSFMLTAGSCQMRGLLGNNYPRTVPRYTTVIPAGRSGWMKFWTSSDEAITGVMINEAVSGLSGGYNLQALTTTSAATLTIPVIPN